MTSVESFPFIVNVVMNTSDDQAHSIANYWRERGYLVRIVPRIVRAAGCSTPVQAVVLVGRKEKSHA